MSNNKDLAIERKNEGNAWISRDPNMAIELYEAAKAADPTYVVAYLNHGRVLAEKIGNPVGAIEQFNKAIEYDPDDIEKIKADAYCCRGYAYRAIDNLELAIFDFSSALKRNPSYANAYFGRALALGETGSETDLRTALRDLKNAIDCGLENVANAHYVFGCLYTKLGNHEKAIEHYDISEKLGGPRADIYGNRGSAHRGASDYYKASDKEKEHLNCALENYRNWEKLLTDEGCDAEFLNAPGGPRDRIRSVQELMSLYESYPLYSNA